MKDTIFITGSGRSGTQWLTDLLDFSFNCTAFHEPDNREQDALVKAHNKGNGEAERYIREEKWPNVQERVDEVDTEKYVEVNSYLRYHHKALLNRADYVLQLVRHPADVIRSTLERNSVVRGGQWVQDDPAPKVEPYRSKWDEWGPFEKCCWYWWHPNKKLFDACPTIRLEDLNRCYEVADRQLFRPWDINMSVKVWSELSEDPRNTGQKSYTPPEEWGSEKHEVFHDICMDLANRMGYECPICE